MKNLESPKIPKSLLKRMESHGYYYDELESYPGYIAFRTECGAFPIVFLSKKELREWINGVVW